MKILYFTATGNSLAVAKRFQAELLSIPQMIRQERYSVEDEVVGIVYPTYTAGLPQIVKRYLRRCEIKAEYVFVIATYGNIAGGTMREMEKALSANGNHADYYESLLMVDNYLPMFEMKDQLSRVEEKGIEKNLTRIVEEVSARTKRPPHGSVGWNIMAAAMGAVQGGFVRNTPRLFFTVSDDCIGCGMCGKVCPVANVTQSGKSKPVFGAKCESCYACVHNCPKKAIHLRTERSGERFRNPEVTVKEIVEANGQNL